MKAWRYLPEGGRDLRLDMLRGYLILAMVIDHVGEGSWLHALTGGDRFVISAAEGFVFISGLVMGIVYCRTIERDGLKPAMKKALARGAKLYVLHATLTLGFVATSGLARAFWFRPIEDVAGFVIGVLALRQTYYLTDVLHLYAVLVLISPVALLFLSRGWTLPLVSGSAGLWLVYQRYPWELSEITGNLAFPAAAWQILFFMGLALGYNWTRVRTLLSRLRPAVTASLLSLAALAILAQHLSSNTLFRTDDWLGSSYVEFFAKADVRPGRLVAAIVFFPLAYQFVTMLWRPFRSILGWLLLPLGQNSLLSYSLHLPVVLVAGTVLGRVGLEGANPGLNSAIQLAGVFTVLAEVKLWRYATAVLMRPPELPDRVRMTTHIALLGLLVTLLFAGSGAMPGSGANASREMAIRPDPGSSAAPTPNPSVLGSARPAASPVSAGPAAQTSSRDVLSSLRDNLAAYVGGLDGTYGLAVRELPDGEPILIDANRPFPAGSLYKLLVMYRVYRSIELGELTTESPLVIEAGDLVEAENGDGLAQGDVLTVGKAVDWMIAFSSNPASYALARTIGGWNGVLAAASELGMSETTWNGDGFVTTPGDVLRFFTLLGQRNLISPGASDEMIEVMLRQTIDDRLPAGLPPGTRVAHKTGELPELRHDAGIVFTERGSYAIAVLSEGIDPPGASQAQAKISQMVFDQLGR